MGEMTLLEGVLIEEYERSQRITEALEEALKGMPRGYLRERVRNGHTYYYHQYRDGDRVVSKYVRREDADDLRKRIELGRQYAQGLKIQEKSRRQIVRALGRRFVDEHSSHIKQKDIQVPD